jgi:hypothetical protein
MHCLHVKVILPGFTREQSYHFLIVCKSEFDRAKWRREFDDLMGWFNREKNLGFMTCLSPEYDTYERDGTLQSEKDWTPSEAAEHVERWYNELAAA